MKLISMGKANRIFGIVLRLIAFGSTLAATVVMATSHESTTVFGVSFEVKYSDTPAFKYFMIANSVVTVYGFLVLFLPSESLLRRFVFAADMVFTMLLSSNISAALAVAEVGKKGNPLAGWLPICGQIPKFCDQVKVALIVAFVSLITYTILLFYSIHNIIKPLLLPKS